MYQALLAMHSLVRWAVLIFLLFAIARAWLGWRRDQPFSRTDNSLRHWTATILHIQLLLGITLYTISPLIRYFLSSFSTAVHQRDVRFFGMEHSTVMLAAVIVATIGSMKAKREPVDRKKHKIIAVLFTIALLLILSSVPWSFSPLASRPNYRSFRL